MNRKHLTQPLILLLFLTYWAISLRHLPVIPPVYEDEPWQASTGWKIADEGIFGSDIFAGFYGMEDHYYGYMPVHPFLLAAVFKLTGFGLFQARFEPVVLGLLILALTYALGRRLFRPSIGLVAVFLLIFTRTTGLTPSQYTGILFIDITRIARYDTAVPLFALSALLMNNELRIINYELRITSGVLYRQLRITNYELRIPLYVLRFTFYVLIGLLTALATFSHLYGLFWSAALFLLLLWHKAKRPQLTAFILGFTIPLLLYAAYVLPNWSDWLGQTQDYAPRFELLNPAWYWQNLINEFQRYAPGLAEGSWFRPGFWTAVITIPLSLIALGRKALQGDQKAQTLVLPTILLPALFALLIYLKLSNYLITLASLFALVMAWGLVKITTASGNVERFGKSLYGIGLLRLLTASLVLLIGIEGLSRFIHLEQAAAATTPYAEYTAEIQSHLPPDGRILALHNYWFNFHSWDYRSWFVPLLQTNPDYWQPPLSIETALNNVSPTIILIDHRMRALFENDPSTAQAIFNWMAAHGFQQAAAVEDQTYGRMDIYLRPTND